MKDFNRSFCFYVATLVHVQGVKRFLKWHGSRHLFTLYQMRIMLGVGIFLCRSAIVSGLIRYKCTQMLMRGWPLHSFFQCLAEEATCIWTTSNIWINVHTCVWRASRTSCLLFTELMHDWFHLQGFCIDDRMKEYMRDEISGGIYWLNKRDKFQRKRLEQPQDSHSN